MRSEGRLTVSSSSDNSGRTVLIGLHPWRPSPSALPQTTPPPRPRSCPHSYRRNPRAPPCPTPPQSQTQGRAPVPPSPGPPHPPVRGTDFVPRWCWGAESCWGEESRAGMTASAHLGLHLLSVGGGGGVGPGSRASRAGALVSVRVRQERPVRNPPEASALTSLPPTSNPR